MKIVIKTEEAKNRYKDIESVFSQLDWLGIDYEVE